MFNGCIACGADKIFSPSQTMQPSNIPSRVPDTDLSVLPCRIFSPFRWGGSDGVHLCELRLRPAELPSLRRRPVLSVLINATTVNIISHSTPILDREGWTKTPVRAAANSDPVVSNLCHRYSSLFPTCSIGRPNHNTCSQPQVSYLDSRKTLR